MVTRSRAATANMSAHETVLGQASSNAVLARTTTSKASPGRERLMSASRSAELKGVEETRMEASQPSTRQSWKKRRRVAAAVEGLVICLFVMVCWMVCSNVGHECL